MIGSFSSGGLGMGVAFTLEDQFSRTASHIERQMQGLSANTDALAAKVATSARMVNYGFTSMAAGAALLLPFIKGSMVRAEFEQYELQLQTLTGSMERAKEVMETIKQDAADNPLFETDSLIQANTMLMANNMEFERARGLVNNLGNALAGAGRGNAELSRMAVNLQQISATGKATGRDIREFAMAGLPIYEMLRRTTGRTVEELQEMDITIEMLEDTFAKAAEKGGMFEGALERAASGTAGKWAEAMDNLTFAFEAMGRAVEPITKTVLGLMSQVLAAFRAFANTGVGQVILRIVAALAIFLLVGGLVLLLVGGIRIGIMRMAWAFGAATRAAVLNTIATKGLTAGLYQMGRAAWASLGPYVLIALALMAFIWIAKKAWEMITEGTETTARWGVVILTIMGPIGHIIMLVAGLTRGFAELKKPMDEMATSGVLGFFTKAAALIETFRQAWASWNGETFALTEDLAQRLEKLGIMDLAMEIASWAVEIQEFFKGVSAWATAFWAVFKQVIGNFGVLSKGGIAEVTNAFQAFWFMLTQKARDTIADIGSFFSSLIDWIPSPMEFYTKGILFIMNLLEGIKSGWASLTTWLDNAFSGVGDMISDKLGGAINFITTGGGLWGDDEDEEQTGISGKGGVPKGSGSFNYHINNTSKNPTIINQGSQQSDSKKDQQPIILQNIMDGDVISESVMNRQELLNARK